MMTRQLSDEEMEKLCKWLESLGLIRIDELGRRRLTKRGNVVGMALYAFAMWESNHDEAEAGTEARLQ